ncbi:hypothetical protein [Cytophaga aurantiaca]|uniref:hypothetical protein n=1 Tax=Cytophaga aurantiaca TaxID=29530 RepID=UPI000375F0CB|nr:hypothetical protein [Cytophaga aurantiaca]
MDLDKSITEILNLINPILIKDESSTLNFPIQFTFHHVLERTTVSLESIRILMKSGISAHDHAIGLLSRNILSDFIIVGYISKFSKNEDDMIDMLNNFYNADLKKVDTYIETLKKLKIAPEGLQEHHLNKYLTDNSVLNYVRTNINTGKSSKTNTNFIISEIHKKFSEKESQDFYDIQIIKSYDTWLLLSKYEHLGWYSYEFTRNLYTEILTKRFSFVLYSTLMLITFSLGNLQEENIKRSVDELIKNIHSKNHFSA